MTSPEWEKILDQYSGKVMGYIAARVQRRADAEDLCADVFEKVYRNIQDYEQARASLGTWIYTITRNTVIDYLRRTKPSAPLDENLSSDGSVDDALLERETLSELASALKALPQDLQDIVVMIYYDGKPMTQIASLMHLSYGAVKLRHQKALAMLKKLLEQ